VRIAGAANGAGAVAGGLLGGVLGNQVGGGSGRTFTRDTAWPLQAGERVRIVDDTLTAAPRGPAPIREAVYFPGT
jgi:uncharacterized protein YcfJ